MRIFRIGFLWKMKGQKNSKILVEILGIWFGKALPFNLHIGIL